VTGPPGGPPARDTVPARTAPAGRLGPMSRPRVLSGIQPTAGSFHLGNYLGALRQWVALQDSHDAFYCVVDLHALTMPWDPALLPGQARLAAAQLLAAGLDPDRCTLFVQSHVAEHAELAWVLGCLTGFGEASRMIQFKDKSARDGQDAASVGLFTYPVLQAADILLYQADQVPVGEDQRQHLELSRTLAQRFNHRFGPAFTVPRPYIPAETAKIYDLQDPSAKMSKSSPSRHGVVDVLDEPDVIRRKIARAVTDAGTEVRADADAKPGVTNLLRIYSALSGEPVAALEARYDGAGYGGFKKDLAEVVVAALAPIREQARRLMADEAGLDRVLAHGAARARRIAAQTMDAVRERIGLLGPQRG
jgi:tryptophanyl-tRNA synthetase